MRAYKSELKDTEARLNNLKKEGYLYAANGTDKVNWSKYDNACGWDLTLEEEKIRDKAREKCEEVETLLYVRNFLMSKIINS